MAWFFTEYEIDGGFCELSGENARHISKSLRMKVGEAVTLVTPSRIQCEGVISDIQSESVTVNVAEKKPCENEPDVFITLFQALPKGDKMDYIIQKCVELGVGRIVPMISSRCVSRPDKKSLEKKRERWQKIALQAAMQSRRGFVPEVCECLSFENAVKQSAQSEKSLFFYELSGEPVKKLLSEKPKSIAVFIGSEGGFSPEEAALAKDCGAETATLGKRILRAETAPLAALSVIMYQTDNFG